MNNADRIRSMSKTDLAKFLAGLENFTHATGIAWGWETWLEWLQKDSETKEEKE